MFGETTIFYIKIWNHPTETSIYKWLLGVPGATWMLFFCCTNNSEQPNQHPHSVGQIE